MPNEEDLIAIGTLMRPHGVRGFIKCKPETHDLNRHKLLKTVFVKAAGQLEEFHVEASSLAVDTWLLKFKEISGREELSRLVNAQVLISAEERLPAPEGKFYFSDLEGFKVVTETGSEVAEVLECVELPSVNAFRIKFTEASAKAFCSGEVLAPWIDDCVLGISEAARSITCSAEFLKSLCPEER